MIIKRLIETENGKAEFEATLSEEELSFVVELGVNILMARGANFFMDGSKSANLAPGSAVPS